MPRILLLDNYDSFTYNLMHYCTELGADVTVKRNDKITLSEIQNAAYNGIVISPGPGAPQDSGICLDVIRTLGQTIPIFGVCLGHQAIGHVYGASIIRHTPMHGKTSDINHHGESVFQGLPSPLTATRYHSLIIDESTLPDCLNVTARTDDGIIMGIQHNHHPLHGVQFHPESIASQYGHEMIQSFLNSL